MSLRIKRGLALFLVACVIFGLLPICAFALNLPSKKVTPSQLFPFTDVSAGAWYFPAVLYVQQHNIMQGTSGTTFSPHMHFSRAMAATTLFRLYHGRPAHAGDSLEHPFHDVPGGAWFAPYVSWAYHSGIAGGIGGGRFAPTSYVDRQQFATMLHRFATRLTDADTSVQQGPQWELFADSDQTESWALEALIWANYHGLITGRTETAIAPDGTTIRAEAAAILARFVAEDSLIPPPCSSFFPLRQPNTLVAHAGGAIEGFGETNSLEALHNSARLGYQLIEVDFLPTSDGIIVLNHNWDQISLRVPGAPNEIVSHAVFMEYRIFGQFTPVDLDMLIEFLNEHSDIRIIADTKDENYAALYAIRDLFPEHMDRFIPQVYQFEDLPRIRAMGFSDLIITLYRLEPWETKYDPEELTRLIHLWQDYIYAITLPDSLIRPIFVTQLPTSEFRFYVHTINSIQRAQELFDFGIFGIYTNFLFYDAYGRLVSGQ